ncbi:MAG TPA: ATP-binding protein [Bacteroidia bacterium]|nr:ATP-binding protein [Bacteroidia bacterium]
MFTSFSLFTPFSAKHVLCGSKNTVKTGTDTYWLSVESSPTGLTRFQHFLLFLEERWQISACNFLDIHLSVTEAIMNAIDHGNKGDANKSVYVCASQDENYFTFTIEDEGDGFNYRRIKNPTDPENRLLPGGRGIFIMNYFSDDLRFADEGRSVKLLFAKK